MLSRVALWINTHPNPPKGREFKMLLRVELG